MSILAFWFATSVDGAALSACRTLTDDAERLRCYDRVVDALRQANSSQTPPAAAVLPSAPRVQPAVSAPTAMVEAPAAAPSDNTRFGLENRRPENAPERIESQVEGPVKGWNRGTRFTLANGQVWEVQDSGETSYNLQSPRVTIERGMMGGFFLKFEGANRRPRVKRIQ